MQMRTIRRLSALTACIICAVCVLCGTIIPGSAADSGASELQRLKDSLAKASADREDALEQLNDVKTQRTTVINQKSALEAAVNSLQHELDINEDLLSEYETEINDTTVRIEKLETELGGKLELLRDRLRLNYEDGNAGYLEILFSSHGLYDFLIQFDRVLFLLDYNNKIIVQCDSARAQLAGERSALIELKTDAKAQRAQYMLRQEELGNNLSEASELADKLSSDVDNAEEAYQKLTEEEASFQLAFEAALAEQQKRTNSAYVGGEFIWPLQSPYTTVSSGFGYRIHPVTGLPQFHQGIDIPAPYGTAIMAINSGTVIETGTHSANGNYIIIDHGGGTASFYAHLSKVLVATGQTVEQGNIIGLVGRTGLATGYHLHLSVYENSTVVDPMRFYS